MDSGFGVKSKDNSYVNDTSSNGLSSGGSYSYASAQSTTAHTSDDAKSTSLGGGGEQSLSLSRSTAASSAADPGQWIQDIMEGSRAQVAALKEAAAAKRNERRQSLPRNLPEAGLLRAKATSRPGDVPQRSSQSTSSADQSRHSDAHYSSNGFDRRSGNFSEPLGYPSQHHHLPAKYGGTLRLPWETQASLSFTVGSEQSACREANDQALPAASDGASTGPAEATGFSAADAAARIANEYRLAAAMGRQEPRTNRHPPAPSVPASVSAEARNAPASVADRKVAAAQKQMERKLRDHAVVLQKRATVIGRTTSSKARPAATVPHSNHGKSATAKQASRASSSLPRPRAPQQSTAPLMSAEAVLRHRRVELAVASSQKEDGGRSDGNDMREGNATASLHGPSRKSGSTENGRRSSSSHRSNSSRRGSGGSSSGVEGSANKSRGGAPASETAIVGTKSRDSLGHGRVSTSPTRSSYSEGRNDRYERSGSTPSPQGDGSKVAFTEKPRTLLATYATGFMAANGSSQESTQENYPESTSNAMRHQQAQYSRTKANASAEANSSDHSPPQNTLAGMASAHSSSSPYRSQPRASPTNTNESGHGAVAAARARADALKLEASAAAPQPLAFLPPSAALRRRMEREAEAADPYYWAQEQLDARNSASSSSSADGRSSSHHSHHHHAGLMGADEVAWRREQRRHGGSSNNNTLGVRSSPELPTDWVAELEAQARTHEDAATEAVKSAQRAAAERSVVEAAMYAAACESDAYSVHAQGFAWQPLGSDRHHHDGQEKVAAEETQRAVPPSSLSVSHGGAHVRWEDHNNTMEQQQLRSIEHSPTQASSNETEKPQAATFEYLQAMRRLHDAQSLLQSSSLDHPQQELGQQQEQEQLNCEVLDDATSSHLAPLVLVPEPPNYDLLEAHDRAMDQHERSSSGGSGGGIAREQTERLPKIVCLRFGTNVLGRTTSSLSSSSPSKQQQHSRSSPSHHSKAAVTVGLDACDIPEALLRAYHTTNQGVRCYLLSQRHVAVTVRPDGISAHVEALAFLQASHALVRVNGRALAPFSSPPSQSGGSTQQGSSPTTNSNDGANAGSSTSSGSGGVLLKLGDKLTLLGGVSKQAPPYAAVRTRAGDLTFTLQRNPAYVQHMQEIERDQARAAAAIEEANRRIAPRNCPSPPSATYATASPAANTGFPAPQMHLPQAQMHYRGVFEGTGTVNSRKMPSSKAAWEEVKEEEREEDLGWEARVDDAGWEARVEAAAAEISTTHQSPRRNDTSPERAPAAAANAHSVAADHHASSGGSSRSSPNAQSSPPPPSSPTHTSSRRNNKSPGGTPLTERGLMEAVAQVTAEEVKCQGQIDALLEEKRVAVVAKQYLTAGHISAQLAKVRASLNCAKVKRSSLAKQAEAMAAELVAGDGAATRVGTAAPVEEVVPEEHDRASQAPAGPVVEGHAGEGAVEAAARAAAAAEVGAMAKAAAWSAHQHANHHAGGARGGGGGAVSKQVVWEDGEGRGNGGGGGGAAARATAAPQNHASTVERALALAAAARAAASEAEVAASAAEANAVRAAATNGDDHAHEPAATSTSTTRRSLPPKNASPLISTATAAASPAPFQAFSPSAFVSTAHASSKGPPSFSQRVSLASTSGSKHRQSNHSIRRDEVSVTGSDAFNGSLYDGDGDDMASSYYDNDSVLDSSSVAGTSISQSTLLLRSLRSKSGHGYQSVAERRAARQQRRHSQLSGHRRFDERGGASAHSVASGYSAASETASPRPQHVSPPGESITAKDFERRRREVMQGFGGGGGSEYGGGYNHRNKSGSTSVSRPRSSRTMSERGGRSHSSSRSESAKLLSSATPLVQAYGRAHGGDTAAELASPRLAAERHAEAMDFAATRQSTQARKVEVQAQRTAEAATAAHRDATRRIARLLDLKNAAVAAEDYALADKYKQQIKTLEAYQRDVATASIERELQALAAQKDEAVKQEDYARAAVLKAKMDSLRLRSSTSIGSSRGSGGDGGLSHMQGSRVERECKSSPVQGNSASEEHLALATRAMRDRGYAPKALVDFGQTTTAGLGSSSYAAYLGHNYDESWGGELPEGHSFEDGELAGRSRETAGWRPAGAVALPGMVPSESAMNSFN